MTTRILHVIGRMDRRGVETWLMNVLRYIDRERFHMGLQRCLDDLYRIYIVERV